MDERRISVLCSKENYWETRISLSEHESHCSTSSVGRRKALNRKEAQKYISFFLIYSIWSCKFYIDINVAENRAEGKLMAQSKRNKLLSAAKYRGRIYWRLVVLMKIQANWQSLLQEQFSCCLRIAPLAYHFSTYYLVILLIATFNTLNTATSTIFVLKGICLKMRNYTYWYSSFSTRINTLEWITKVLNKCLHFA